MLKQAYIIFIVKMRKMHDCKTIKNKRIAASLRARKVDRVKSF